jgi:hypothetical protein
MLRSTMHTWDGNKHLRDTLEGSNKYQGCLLQ